MEGEKHFNIRMKLPGNASENWIEELNDAIAGRLNDPGFGVAELAALMQMSERSLHNQVHKNTGFTPKKYINELRLLAAEQLLLKHSYRTISEVCYAVGFEKPTYFSKLFKERFGQLPSELMRNKG